jgi:predicted kinase
LRSVGEERRPLVIAVCGAPASGKTHLSKRLAAVLGLAHISADVVRKQLSRADPGQRAAPDTFTGAFRRAIYEELGRRAGLEVASSGGALVSAAFQRRDDRQAFTSALDGSALLAFVECTAPAEILAERASRRDRFPWRASDAALEVVRHVLATWEPLDEIAREARLTVRTDRRTEEVVADVLTMLDRRALSARAGAELVND